MKVVEREAEAAHAAAEKLDRQLTAQRHALELREDAVRRLPAHQDLLASTATAAYLVAVAELIKEKVEGPRVEALARLVDEYLKASFERLPVKSSE